MRIQSFALQAKQMIRDWSREEKEYSFINNPTPSESDQVKGWQWARHNSGIPFVKRQLITGSYFVPGSKSSKMKFSKYCRLSETCKFKTFNTFVLWLQAYHCIRKEPNSYLYCSCPMGQKHYSCKHTVAVNVLKYHGDVSERAKAVPLSEKLKVGRPKKVGIALSHD
jgi:hypothetical protein